MSGHAAVTGATLGGRNTSTVTEVGRPVTPQAEDPEVLRLKHDLIQPLAAIMWSLEAVHGSTDLPSHLRVALEQIDRQAVWMRRLLLEALDESPQVAVVDLGDALAGSCSMPASAPYEVVFTKIDSAPVLVEPVGLERAVRNLLDNAMQAVGDGGRIEVNVGTRGGYSVAEFADSGPGFGQVAPRHGHGLVVVRSFVERCGGRLVFGTSSLGGALVQLVLPRPAGW